MSQHVYFSAKIGGKIRFARRAKSSRAVKYRGTIPLFDSTTPPPPHVLLTGTGPTHLALDLLCLVARGWMMALYLSRQMATRVHVDTFT
jgi:hypothetical protein